MIGALIRRDLELMLSHPHFAFLPAVALGFGVILLSYLLPTDYHNQVVEITLVLMSFVIFMKPSLLQYDQGLGVYQALPQNGHQRRLYAIVKFGVLMVYWSCIGISVLAIALPSLTLLGVIHIVSFVTTLVAFHLVLNHLAGAKPVQGTLVFIMGMPLIIPSLLLCLAGLKDPNSTILLGHSAYGVLSIFLFGLCFRIRPS